MNNLLAFLLGLIPPFCIKNIKRKVPRICNRIPESECSILTILNYGSRLELSSLKIMALIYNDHFNSAMKMKLGVPLILFECYHEVQLFFYKNDTTSSNCSIYSSKLSCCRNWGEKYIKAINLFDETDFIEITLRIDNARSKNDYHYNIVERPTTPILFGNLSKIIEIDGKFQCSLCFRLFLSRLSLIEHFECFHITHQLKESNSNLLVEKSHLYDEFNNISRPAELSENFSYGQFLNSSKGIDFCSQFIESGSPSSHYLDFCSGISIDFEDSFIENTKIDEKDTEEQIGLFKPSLNSIDKINQTFDKSKKPLKLSYFPLKLPLDLVNAIFNHKLQNNFVQRNNFEKATKVEELPKGNNSSSIGIFFIQPFEIKHNPNKSNLFSNSKKCYLNVIMETPFQYLNRKYLKESNKNFSFYKSRSTVAINYELKEYGLLIQREYNKIDYSNMLSNYLNKRIDSHLKNNLINEEQHRIMASWNKLFIEYGKIEDCLMGLLNIYGLSEPCVEVIELLYTRGLLNSEEIQIIIKNVKDQIIDGEI